MSLLQMFDSSSRQPPPPSPSQGTTTSAEETPATSPNVAFEFELAVQANSYNEIRTIIEAPTQILRIDDREAEEDNDGDEESHHRNVLSQVLQPDQQSIREVLANSKPKSTLTRLVSTYFDHSETTSDLCLHLFRCVNRARHNYSPLSDFLAVIPSDSLSQPQCDRAYDLFLQFDQHENPFTFSQFHSLRNSFSELKLHIQRDRRKCHSRLRLLRHAAIGCAACLIATVVGTVACATIFSAHAAVGFAAVTAAPFCNPVPKKRQRRELERLKQLEVAENGTLVVNDINTIDSLVDRLQTAVEGDKAHVRFALERGRERHPIQEVLKQLRKNQPVLEQLLMDLEQHIYFCFYTVNKARRALLREISIHQTS